MADITMCKVKDCPLKEGCYRFKAEPSKYRQSYFIGIPFDKKNKKCDMYWKNKFENGIK